MLQIPELKHHRADLDDISLDYAEAGEGPAVFLLHGFPEFWYSWRHQIPALTEAGFRVIVPDMRGYNGSAKPKQISAYSPDKLADDILNLSLHLNTEIHGVVGHDWGGAVAWYFAMRHPESFQRLSILNCPHPRQFLSALGTLKQLRKSWYMFFFQLPWLPEKALSAGNYKAIRKIFTEDPVRDGAFQPADIDAYIDALSQPGALRGAINYYRAAFRQSPWKSLKDMNPIDLPVQILWGTQDKHLGRETAKPPENLVPRLEIEYCEDASHWLMVDRPQWVNERLIPFLKRD
tara:strand:- start:100 stop:972 length:873 start_codon:yes stop_codon:yes gene_type:complete